MIVFLTLFAGLLLFLIPAYGETDPNSSAGKDAFAQAASRTRSRIDRAAVKFDGQIRKQPNHQQSYIREKWALFVGISQFKDSQIQPLKVASNNALLLDWAFKDPTIGRFTPSHLASFLGASATKQAVQNAILDSALIRKALPDDLIILYFSTRLVPLTNENDICLCAYDTSLSQAPSTGIKLSEILSNLQKLTQCQQILCILDCPSTSASVNAKAISFEEVSKRTGVTILSANQVGEDSKIDRKGTFSCFSRYLATGLKETHGNASLQNLTNYIQENFARDKQDPSATAQNVNFIAANETSKMGEIIIGAPPLGAWYAAELANQALAHAKVELPVSPIEALEAKAESQSKDVTNKNEAKVDFGPWMSKMKKDIKNKWNCPVGYEHEHTSVIFSIMRDGSIFNPYVEETSGIPTVDKSALEAIKAASPLTPLPEGAPDFVRVRYLFDWRVSHKY
jgi:TonB C terminal/Caspase domain